MKQYLDLCYNVLTNGTPKVDRTGVGTRSLFGTQIRFDLKKEFSIVKAKFTSMRLIAIELDWLLQGSTNIKYLVDNNCHIWDEWMIPEKNVGGPSERRPLIMVPVKRREPTDAERTFDCGSLSIAGNNFSRESIEAKLAGTWRHMMLRCYDKSQHNFAFYGGAGVFVVERWHSVENFVSDVRSLQNWNNKLDDWAEYELDKDYYGSNHYGPDTCVWLSERENKLYIGSTGHLEVSSPEGKKKLYLSLAHASDDLDIARTTLDRWVQNDGEVTSVKEKNSRFLGWSFKRVKPSETENLRMAFSFGELGPVYGEQWRAWERPAKFVRDTDFATGEELENEGYYEPGEKIDQIRNVVEALKKDPDGRRIIISAWNVGEIQDMALPPCHAFVQFFTRELSLDERFELLGPDMPMILTGCDVDTLHRAMDTNGVPRRGLSCQLYQRSADLFLGVPFNIASYSLLTHIIAQEVNMIADEFIWTGGDTHLYANSFRETIEMLERPLITEKARLVLDPAATTDNFRFDMVKLENYVHHKSIKVEVAV